MSSLLLLLFFLSIGINGNPDESDLSVYLRDIGWGKVQDLLKKDLRLAENVKPIHYELFLNVSILGYEEAKRSTFDGHLVIELNVTQPYTDSFEIHSVGIKHNSVVLYSHAKPTEIINRGRFEKNKERETIRIRANRLFELEEKLFLVVSYTGVSTMNGAGLYESWNTYNVSSPFISLLTQGAPACTRYWLPSFDQPNMKATFKLTVEHPKTTTAHSNMPFAGLFEGEITRRTTIFKTTPILPTYLLSLSITEQPAVYKREERYQYGAIGRNKEDALESVIEARKWLLNHSHFEGIPFIAEKTDILMAEDFGGAMENLGLITFGSSSVSFAIYKHELAHMYFGNLVTLSSWDDTWLNEGFATLFANDLLTDSHSNIFYSQYTHHSTPLHTQILHTSSTFLKEFFGIHSNVHYQKGAQTLQMIREYMGEERFDECIKRYLKKYQYGNVRASDLTRLLEDNYRDGEDRVLEDILNDWIYQPRKPMVLVERMENGVRLSQREVHSTATPKSHDLKWTIPIPYTIDGKDEVVIMGKQEPFTFISVPENSNISIIDKFGELYTIVYTEPEDITDTSKVFQWIEQLHELFLLGDYSIEQFVKMIIPTMKNPGTIEKLRKYISTEKKLEESKDSSDPWTEHIKPKCIDNNAMDVTYNDAFEIYLKISDPTVLFCLEESRDRPAMKRWLHDAIMANLIKLKSFHLSPFIRLIETLHNGLVKEFILETLYYHTTDHNLRWKLPTIVKAYIGTSRNYELLRDLVRRYPEVMVDLSGTVQILLEKEYMMNERMIREKKLGEALVKILPMKKIDDDGEKNMGKMKKKEKKQNNKKKWINSDEVFD